MELPETNINRITYSNLSYGNYQLIISKLGKDGQPSDQPLYSEYPDSSAVVLYNMGKSHLCFTAA